jgi:hypothetical protein
LATSEQDKDVEAGADADEKEQVDEEAGIAKNDTEAAEQEQDSTDKHATTLWSFDHVVGFVMRIRSGVILCCLAIAVTTFVARLLGVCEGNIIFMESFGRVTR